MRFLQVSIKEGDDEKAEEMRGREKLVRTPQQVFVFFYCICMLMYLYLYDVDAFVFLWCICIFCEGPKTCQNSTTSGCIGIVFAY